MGESAEAASHHEDKMRETASSVPFLDVSVSFGRFENDSSLSWEKWSSFSPNKYLEEVEKCATPGSVAQKKAYFEAHYKKIAARKAEMMDQKQMDCESFGNDDPSCEEQNPKNCGIDSEFNVANRQNDVEGFMQESESNVEWSNGHIGEDSEDAAMNVEAQDSLEAEELLVDGGKEEIKERLDNPKLEKTQDVLLMKEEETPLVGSQDRKEESPNNLEKQMESIPKKEEEPGKDSKKVTPLSKITDVARVKKKPVSPATKLPQFSTPKISKIVSSSTALSSSTPKVLKSVQNSATLSRATPKVSKPMLKSTTILSRSTPQVSKPTPNSTVLSASQASTGKLTGSFIAKSKIHSVGDNKKVGPKALHMSLRMDSPRSDPASLTNTRKLFIMEKMGDKDIVKRAFKTFQNNFHQLKASAEQRSLEAKQVPAKVAEMKISSSMNPRKENSGMVKASGMDKKTAKAAPSSFTLKSDEGLEKRKELPKKFEGNSYSKEAGITRLQKSKEKEADWTKSRQNFNFRATPLPSFYHGHKVSKAPLDKVGSKTLRI